MLRRGPEPYPQLMCGTREDFTKLVRIPLARSMTHTNITLLGVIKNALSNVSAQDRTGPKARLGFEPGRAYVLKSSVQNSYWNIG